MRRRCKSMLLFGAQCTRGVWLGRAPRPQFRVGGPARASHSGGQSLAQAEKSASRNVESEGGSGGRGIPDAERCARPPFDDGGRARAGGPRAGEQRARGPQSRGSRIRGGRVTGGEEPASPRSRPRPRRGAGQRTAAGGCARPRGAAMATRGPAAGRVGASGGVLRRCRAAGRGELHEVRVQLRSLGAPVEYKDKGIHARTPRSNGLRARAVATRCGAVAALRRMWLSCACRIRAAASSPLWRAAHVQTLVGLEAGRDQAVVPELERLRRRLTALCPLLALLPSTRTTRRRGLPTAPRAPHSALFFRFHGQAPSLACGVSLLSGQGRAADESRADLTFRTGDAVLEGPGRWRARSTSTPGRRWIAASMLLRPGAAGPSGQAVQRMLSRLARTRVQVL